MKYIVNADDFGLDQSCTHAIIDSFQCGIITDTTACANGKAIDEAIELAHQYHVDDRIGIHFNVTAGKPLTDKIRSCRALCDENGYFKGPSGRRKPLTSEEKELLYRELTEQYGKLKSMGIRITHADSHHHIHTSPSLFRVFDRAMKDCNIVKVRLSRNVGIDSFVLKQKKNIFNYVCYKTKYITTDYFGSVGNYSSVKESDKTAEVMVHPDYKLGNGYLIDRVDRVNGLPDGKELPELSKAYPQKNIQYISYSELK